VLAVVTTSVLGVRPPAAPRASRLALIGTYTGPASRGIYAFRFDDRTGALTPIGLAAETPNPSFLTASADGRFVYAVNETEDFGGDKSGSVTAFSVDEGTGRLTRLNVQSTHGAAPCHLTLDRTGKFLAVANYTGGNFVVFPVKPDGSLGPSASSLTNPGSGPNRARQDGPHAHDVVFDRTNAFLLGVDLGLDKVHIYNFVAATGAVTPHAPAFATVPPGSGPRHLAWHPDGRRLFVINELLSTIASFTWAPGIGALSPVASVSTLPAGWTGENSTAEIAVHPNGRFVYGSNRGHDSVAIFSIGADSRLTPIGHEATRGRTPRNFTIDPTGRWLVAGNQDTNTLAVFAIDAVTGKLTPTGPLADVGAPVSILFMR